MEYYKPLTNLNISDNVFFKKIGKEEQGNYGPYRQCDITVDGKDMIWTLSSEKYDQLTKAGFGEGSSVIIQKWKEGVKKGYNFQKHLSTKAAEEVFYGSQTPPPKDDFQDKISRGASLNLAAQYGLYKACGGPLECEEWWAQIEQYAEQIAPKQQKFVN